MIKTFTENDLVRFIYGETNPTETEAIQNAIMCDSVMQDTHRNLTETISSVESTMLSPGKKVVEKILDYSKNYGDMSVLK